VLPRLLVAACLMALALPGAAHAASFQESIAQDERQLLYNGPDVREQTLDELQSLGVDTIRVLFTWSDVAPEAGSTRRPPNFDAANPAHYPAEAWNRYDALVRSAARRRLGLILTPTTPMPVWASQCRGSPVARTTCNPDPAAFGALVRAVGTRYSGAYPDEDDGGALLPRVRRWGLMNEAHVGRWMTPQFVRRRGRIVPASPARYRRLALAAVAALRATGHRRDLILLGESAPIGHTRGPLVTRPVATAEFWRNLLCIDRAGRPLRGRAAVEQDCRRRFRLNVTAAAHHPYVRGGSRPPLTPPRRDEITIGSIGRLKAILAAGARHGRIPRGLPIWYTENGFQTNPPDRLLGVSLRAQVSHMHQADWIAYRDRSVRSVAQYLLRDDPTLGGFQSGLRFNDGSPKPSLAAYRFPVWAVRRGIFVTVFGQVRDAPDGARGVVRVQVRLPGKQFTTYREVRPNRKGFVLTRLRSRRGTWRLYWVSESGTEAISRETQEARR